MKETERFKWFKGTVYSLIEILTREKRWVKMLISSSGLELKISTWTLRIKGSKLKDKLKCLMMV